MDFKKILKSKGVIGLAIAFGCLSIAKYFFIYNVTPSIQTGLYMRMFPTFPVKAGDVIVEIVPYTGEGKVKDEKSLREHGVIKDGKIRKVKTVAGVAGDVISIKGDTVFVNGQDYGQIFSFSGHDYLSEFKRKYDGYRIREGEYIALSKRTGSLDGRYEDGVRKISDIKGKYRLLIRGMDDLGYCFEENIKNDSRCELARKYGENPHARQKLKEKGSEKGNAGK